MFLVAIVRKRLGSRHALHGSCRFFGFTLFEKVAKELPIFAPFTVSKRMAIHGKCQTN